MPPIVSDYFECEKALLLLAVFEDWEWINNYFIMELIWPDLKLWVAARDDSGLTEHYITSLLRILGLFTTQTVLINGKNRRII